MNLEQQLNKINKTENCIKQTQNLLCDLLTPLAKIQTIIHDRCILLKLLNEPINDSTWDSVEVVVNTPPNWSTGERAVLCRTKLSEDELIALQSIIKQTIDSKINQVDFQKIEELANTIQKISE